MASGLITKVHSWCEQHLKAVMGEIYDRNPDRACQKLQSVRKKLDNAGFTPDEYRAGEILLLRVEYFINRIRQYPDRKVELFEETCSALEGMELTGPIATVMYHRVMLELLIAADRDSVCTLDDAGFHEHFDLIPEADRNASIWHSIASWLFDHHKVELLQKAYESLLTHKLSLKQYPMRRTRLMYLLASGATHEDGIVQYLSSLTLQNALNEFKWCFMPVIEEQGLATDKVRQLLKATEQRFQKAPPGNPFDD